MLRRPKHSKIEVVVPKEGEEVYSLLTGTMKYRDANTTTLLDVTPTAHYSYNDSHLPTEALL